jgi:hypothetical protein
VCVSIYICMLGVIMVLLLYRRMFCRGALEVCRVKGHDICSLISNSEDKSMERKLLTIVELDGLFIVSYF